MTTGTTTYVIEINREEIEGDPIFNIFRVITLWESMGRKSEWREAFGSVEQLNVYLKGMETILTQEGFPGIRLHWYVKVQWNEPVGLRFTIDPTRCLVQELRSDGSVRRV